MEAGEVLRGESCSQLPASYLMNGVMLKWFEFCGTSLSALIAEEQLFIIRFEYGEIHYPKGSGKRMCCQGGPSPNIIP